MYLFNENNVFQIIKFAEPSISGVAVIVKWLIGISSSIAFGIILFTLALKLITFPFDFFSRYSMRKNSVKMEEMRPDLEKLQKQYANDKTLYNQKMMALYKKNGYSMWGSCLPTIITLVIFIVAINGYSSYSSFINKQYFYNMSLSYNSVVYDGVIEDTNGYITKDEKTGEVIINEEILNLGSSTHCTAKNGGEFDFYIETIEGNKKFIKTSTGYTSILLELDQNGKIANQTYYLDENNFVNINSIYKDANCDTVEKAKTFLEDLAQQRSADTYKSEQVNFLWVKNIWVTDSPLAHPVSGTWEASGSGCASCFGGDKGFVSSYGYDTKITDKNINNMNENYYKALTAKLDAEKTEANGYFILCVISAGISFLMQLVMSKSQKAQMELQTVDGQGARTQKMMMWMMPILMAFFSFMYTAAFSIYLILSSAISIATTFLINWVVNKKLGKAKGTETKQIVRGRVHDEPLQVKKNNKKDVKKKVVKRDFIPDAEDDGTTDRKLLK